MTKPTFDELNAILSYDPVTGLVTWKVDRGTKTKAGKETGCIDKQGYRVMILDGKMYQIHRIAWVLATGDWPKHCIDHINGIRSDNRLSNLRDVTHKMNMQNRAIKRTQKGRLAGTRLDKNGRWWASIGINGRHKYLGVFDSMEEAHAAFLEAKRIYHPGWVDKGETN